LETKTGPTLNEFRKEPTKLRRELCLASEDKDWTWTYWRSNARL